jgi:hypothetical protein
MSAARAAVELCCNGLAPETLTKFKNMKPGALRDREFRKLLPAPYDGMDRKTLSRWLDGVLKAMPGP